MVFFFLCIFIKRIDKIIFIVRFFVFEYCFIKIKWIYLGGGVLKFDFEFLVRMELGEFENVSFYFMGEVENKEVKVFFLNNVVDFFINVSELEGVLVFIMEVMSVGVFVIVFCVGGIRFLIDNSCGWLFFENFIFEEYCSLIFKFYLGGDRKIMWEMVCKKIEKDFSFE